MAYYFLFPEKDTTLYSHPKRTTMNTGGDEILEIVKEKGNSDQRYYPSRVLIKFKSDEIRDVISSKIGSTIFNNGTTKATIQLSTTEHKNLTSILNLETFAVSQSWNEGTGRFTDIPTTSNGSSWTYRDNDILKTQWMTSSFATATTGSINTSGITRGGGEWYTDSLFQGSQQFLRGANMDTDIDVTSIVQKHSASLF